MRTNFRFDLPRIYDVRDEILAAGTHTTVAWVPRAARRMIRWRGPVRHQMHDTVAWVRRHATSIRGNGGVRCHATIIIEQWHKIHSMVIPRQQRRNRCATNGLFYTSVS
jgi:hypothetical protein